MFAILDELQRLQPRAGERRHRVQAPLSHPRVHAGRSEGQPRLHGSCATTVVQLDSGGVSFAPSPVRWPGISSCSHSVYLVLALSEYQQTERYSRCPKLRLSLRRLAAALPQCHRRSSSTPAGSRSAALAASRRRAGRRSAPMSAGSRSAAPAAFLTAEAGRPAQGRSTLLRSRG